MIKTRSADVGYESPALKQAPRLTKIKTMNIWLLFVLLVNCFFPWNGWGLGADNMERRIILLPIGEVEGWVLDLLEKGLAKEYDGQVVRHNPVEVPRHAFNPARGQYQSSVLLQRVRRLSEPDKKEKILGIVDVDLYTPGLNFVFGQAELRGECAVISLARLRQSFYSLPDDKQLFSERAVKEAVHELGHVYGLEHCPDPECVMHFSNSLSDTDRKRAGLCSQCRAILQNP